MSSGYSLIKSNCIHHTQHSALTLFPLCLVPSEPGRADVGLCICVCVCLFRCHPSSISIHALLCKSCFSCPFFFPSPLLQTSSVLKTPISEDHPTQSRPSVCLNTCSNYTSLFARTYSACTGMRASLNVSIHFAGSDKKQPLLRPTVALCAAQTWTETPTVGSLPVVGSKNHTQRENQ